MLALEEAARASLHAPSVFNTQPWTWRIAGDTLELYADPARKLDSTDPEGRLLILSCGAALHHARTALAAAGWSATVERFPDDSRPGLLARIRLGASVPPDPEAQRMAAAIPRRRTDRRAFGEREVTDAELTKLLHGGEALSALLLLATADGLATAPISDAIEAEWPRHLLRSLLADIGEPYLVVRLGHATSHEPLPPSPRREPSDVIFTE